MHARKFLLDGSNFNLAVDGSVTPVVFQIDIQPTELFLIDNIELTLTDKGNVNDLEDFMVITGGLTNGLLTDATLANPSPAVTVRTNYGLLNRMGTGSSLSQIGQDSVFSGRLHFNAPVIVDGSQGHNIRVTVRDDLTGLLLSTVAVSGVVKVIS